MQKMEEALRVLIAKIIPMLMQVGKAGGTTMVTMSKLLFIISLVDTLFFIISSMLKEKPQTPMTPNKAKNLRQSL
jgi:hypothetical protein